MCCLTGSRFIIHFWVLDYTDKIILMYHYTGKVNCWTSNLCFRSFVKVAPDMTVGFQQRIVNAETVFENIGNRIPCFLCSESLKCAILSLMDYSLSLFNICLCWGTNTENIKLDLFWGLLKGSWWFRWLRKGFSFINWECRFYTFRVVFYLPAHIFLPYLI